ncbi:MAG: hypothetical protein JWN93_2588, partial [Hyphomicrobiales bacterium]|nr:hypothetical protein [Hyphomicrobiales bacterium]
GYRLAAAALEHMGADFPVIAIDSHAGAAVEAAVRAAGMRGAAGKFDRRGLLAALAGALDDKPFGRAALEARGPAGPVTGIAA